VEVQTSVNVGERIKALRSTKSMSLRLLAQKSGVSANALSLIERNKTSPTVTTLTAIARAFNMGVNEFFSDEDRKKGDFVIYRGDAAAMTAAQEALAPNLKQQNLNPLMVRLSANDKSRKELCFHPGDEFVYCLSGEVECEVGREKIRLAQGDALTFKGEIPHRLNNLASEGSQALVVFEVGHLV
jgi:transcriptional regulator with XRE-family HTH domain